MMGDIIVLSSSDEDGNIVSMPPSQKIEPSSSLPREPESHDIDDFDYGTYSDFDKLSPEPEEVPSSYGGKRSEDNNLLSSYNGDKRKARLVHDLSDSDSDNSENIVLNIHRKTNQSSDDELPDININVGPSFTASKRPENFASNIGPSTLSCWEKSPDHKLGKDKKREETRVRKQLAIAEKAKQRQALKEERERKKKEAAYAKALKHATAEIERSKKPGECIKWVTSILDPGLLNAEYSGELLTALRACEVDYKVEECVIPCSVTWERRLQNVQVDDAMTVKKTSTIQNEPFVLIVLMWDIIVQQIHDNVLISSIEEFLSVLPGKKITLVIFGLEDYFRFQKTQKRRDVRSEIAGPGPSKGKQKVGPFEAAPVVSRGDVEFALAELQVKSNVGHRCVNSKVDVANIVCQFTKAIAEAPFKREKHQKDADRLDWYASADSKDCVVVDKDGNGSLQLWQRQLCQFPLASRETSEAIASVYPSPLSVLQAYERCSNEDEAQRLLEDIPVRRGPGVLSTSRRIGPQLSKKIHTFFTTFDEDCLIAPD